MKRIALGLFVAWFALLALPQPAAAQRIKGLDRPFPSNRMPGWDWRRIYPYSPYNYGRNPYYGPWNAPPPYPMPYPTPYPAPYYTNAYYNGPQAPILSADSNQNVLVPHPTGEVRRPPPDAAIIQVRLPERFAELSFNGEKTSSVGNTRYFVTPNLGNDKSYHYVITAKWTQNGQAMSAERQVDVFPGKTSHVDFTQAGQ